MKKLTSNALNKKPVVYVSRGTRNIELVLLVGVLSPWSKGQAGDGYPR